MRRITLLLLSLAVLLAGCGAQPEVKRVVLTDQVDERQAPARAVEAFPEGARTFYVAVLVTNPVKGTPLRVRWQLQDKLIDEYTLTMPDDKDRWAAFDLKATQTFPRGRYKADVFLEDKLVRTVEFSVQ